MGCIGIAPVRPPSPAIRASGDARALGGGGWIRTSVALASDLQSDGFNHSPTPPNGVEPPL